MAVPVAHGVPTVGYQVSSPQGKKLFYTGDTGAGLDGCWQQVSPDLLITELSLPTRMEDWARKVTHLTPTLEDEIEKEVAQVAEELGANIALGREGMKIQL